MNRAASFLIRVLAFCVMVLTPLSGSVHPVVAQGSGATIQLLMRGCPEGFNPSTGDFYAECTIPLDAPDASIISSSQGTTSIPYLDRQWDGSYLYYAGPGGMNVDISGLAPVLRDGYQVLGADGSTGETFHISLVDGETRNIAVFYYYTLPGTVNSGNQPAEAVEAVTVQIATANALGYPMHGVCYELVELGRHACMDPATQYVVFDNIPPGRYTARQTEDMGDNYVTDITFDVPKGASSHLVGATIVTPWGSPSRIGKLDDVEPVDYDVASWPGNTDNVTVVFMDASTGQVARIDGCVQIVGITQNACSGQWGQVGFVEIPAGPHEIEVTRLPEGYLLAPGMETLPLENPGGSPNGPLHIAYFIDVLPQSADVASQAPASGTSTTGMESELITICASNRHGVDYPAWIFNLTPEAAIAAGFMVDDGQGNLVPEWQGVRPGECSFASGFHLYEYVPDVSATVTYCENKETRERPANAIGVTFIDPASTGQSRNPGTTLIDWRSAPEGVVPGPCSAPVGMSGDKLYGEIVGGWEGAYRSALFNEDGTGVVHYNESTGIDFVELDVVVDTGTFPNTARVVDISTGGNPDLTRYPAVGDTITLMIAPPAILEIELVPGWSIALCEPGVDENHFISRCFE